jgi:hypothetical protein
LAFARILKERFAYFTPRVDRAENVPARTMEKAGDTAERFALRAFAAAWRAKKDEGLISHLWNFFYKTNGNSGQYFPASPEPRVRAVLLGLSELGWLSFKLPSQAALLRRHGIDIYPASRAIETHVSINQGENSIIAPKANVLARQKFRPALPDDDITRYNQLASKFFHAQPFADAVPAVLDAALSFFVSH